MRYSREHKAETHQKIVNDASRRVRTEGMAGASVAAVMQDNGLTHGGFYKHFESKDDLLLESLHVAFAEIGDRLVQAAEKAPRGSAWKAIVKSYLNAEHCDHVECGCPLAALGSELRRTDKGMRAQILREVMQYKSRMVPFMPGRRAEDKEKAFLSIFSTMIGAIEIARILPEPAMREGVLANAREFLLRSF
ncbi:MAG TPA: TetR/AcrR family transcriptional regulator [Edaphobacter sp.]|nr:TetR/AcrR family transcriptional regulator [Edaphobacter sp.]